MSSGIKWLREVTSGDLPDVGSKAVILSRLLRGGFSVPEGFVIPASFYRHCIGDDILYPFVDDLPKTFSKPALHTITGCSHAIVKAIQQCMLPNRMKHAVKEAYGKLISVIEPECDRSVIARSSGTLEDLPETSFAGLYDSITAISSEESLLTAVKTCWCSLWSVRAISYRIKNNLMNEQPAMAVIIQRYILCDFSGVIFTVNPITGSNKEMVIDIAEGPVSTVVSGQINPVKLVIDRQTITVKSTNPADNDGITSASGQTCHVSDDEIKTLTQQGLQVERLLGSPQDIEWGCLQNRIYLFQSRSITTFHSPKTIPVVWGHPSTPDLFKNTNVYWSNWNTREVMSYPQAPLSWTYFTETIIPPVNETLFGLSPDSPLHKYSYIVDLVYGRIYWNMNLVLGHPLYSTLFRFMHNLLDENTSRLFQHLTRSGEMVRADIPRTFTGFWLPVFMQCFQIIRHPWFASSKRIEHFFQNAWNRGTEYESIDQQKYSIQELIEIISRFTSEVVRQYFPWLAVAISKLWVSVAVLNWLLKGLPEVSINDLAAGLDGNKTMECALAMYSLSQVPDTILPFFKEENPEKLKKLMDTCIDGREFVTRLTTFLKLFGHRCAEEMNLAVPRWREDPSFILTMIRQYLRMKSSDINPLQHFQIQSEKRQSVIETVEKKFSTHWLDRLLPIRRWLFRNMVRRYQTNLLLRENPKHYAMKLYNGTRRIFLEIGNRYTEQGLIDTPEDIFFLTFHEIKTLSTNSYQDQESLRFKTLSRKTEWETFRSEEPPFVVRSDGLTVDIGDDFDNKAMTLRGTAASSGTVTGIAYLLKKVDQAGEFPPGSILVAPATDPGWTPLFLLAKGLVMEVGGVLSHGAIVAREYGIPAVVGVTGATRRIKTGNRIRINGFDGTVTLLNHPENTELDKIKP
ncbi:hypothetical protein JW979_01515 [bacterium]|nr:hypothetical protein [candidate division CSSED10-310 bacterium]